MANHSSILAWGIPSLGERAHTHMHTNITLRLLSRIPLFATLWTGACQALLSLGLPRQEYWSGLPRPPPGESSRPRDRTHVYYVSCVSGWVLYH